MFEDFAKKRIHSLFTDNLIEAVNEKGGLYVAGGFFTSLVTRKEVNDYDIYFKNKESLVELVKWFEDEGLWCTFISDKSLNYVTEDGDKLQLIYYDYYESAQHIFDHFDFTINMCAWDSTTDEIVADENFYVHNAQRYLHFNQKTKFPLLSSLRVDKYKQRGYYISKSQYLSIMMTITQLEINSWKEFKEHCGSLYGFNHINDESFKDLEYTFDNALSVLHNTDFEAPSIVEMKYDPRLISFILDDKPIKCIEVKGELRLVDDVDYCLEVMKLIREGVLKSEIVTLKEAIGKYVYKWVRDDLCSHYNRKFQYNIGEEVCGKGRNNQLWFVNRNDIFSYGTYRNKGVILECEYNEADIVNYSRDITLTKCVPVATYTKESFCEKYRKTESEDIDTDYIPW